MSTEHTTPVADYHEPEYYAEPADLRGRDIAGVVLALLALTIIGYCGYVWLNPDLQMTDILARLKPGHTEMAASSESGSSNLSKAPPRTTPAMNHTSCPYCGMFTDQSESQIIAKWSDGSETHHDGWDCAFSWGAQQNIRLESAQVSRYGSEVNEPDWLDAAAATYLYDTKELKEAMPPFAAAFADRAAAEAAQGELGGTLVDFAGLQKSFGAGQ